MPKLFSIGGYTVYFWSDENDEPIHVHVSKGRPSKYATKLWITKAGGCIVATNGSRIPQKKLEELMEIITAQHFYICRKWKEHFCEDDIKFFC